MSDNELLLALSDMMDKKLSAQLEPMKKDINDIKNEVLKINIVLENEISIELIKKVFTEHSEKLEKIS